MYRQVGLVVRTLVIQLAKHTQVNSKGIQAKESIHALEGEACLYLSIKNKDFGPNIEEQQNYLVIAELSFDSLGSDGDFNLCGYVHC